MSRARVLADYVSSGDELALKAPLANPTFTGNIAMPDDSIDLAHMSANSVDSDQYVDGSIDLAHMSVNSIDSDQYVDGSIDNAHIADNAIDSEHYAAGSIDNEHLADDAVGTDELANDVTISTSGTITTIGSGARLDISKAITGANDQELLKIGRTGGSTSDGVRQASISFADGNNPTYVGKISGYRDNSAADYSGGLRFYVNPHAVNGNGTFANLNGTPALYCKSNQDVEVPIGNLVIGSAGKGITFSSTNTPAQSAGTGTHNTLDDYEEGTFTPVLGGTSGTSGQTYGTQNGTYTKVGRLVNCSWYVNLTAKGTISGDLAMLGFPFPCGAGQRSAAALGYIYAWTLTSGHILTNFMENTTSILYLQEYEGTGDGVVYLTTSNVGNTTKLMGNISYLTA
jgi:hypothetical protein